MGIVIMQGVPKIFGALRGHLCDSIAFLFFETQCILFCVLLLVMVNKASCQSVWNGCESVQPPPKVKSPTVGKGRGAGSRRGSGRAQGQGQTRKRVHHSEDNASEEEKYIPRSSKRRAAVAAVSRMKQPSDYEDDDFDDVLPARPIPVNKPITKTGRPRGRPPGRGRKPAGISDDSDAGQNSVGDYNSSEDTPPKKKRAADKTKPTCQYGKECYRLALNF